MFCELQEGLNCEIYKINIICVCILKSMKEEIAFYVDTSMFGKFPRVWEKRVPKKLKKIF